jgi:hypothetical protein
MHDLDSTMPARRAMVLALAFAAATAPADALCTQDSVLTLLATDTRTDTSLFAVSDTTAGERLVVLDVAAETARVFADELAGRRRGASHGPGPFLLGSRCGDDCLQPVQFDDGAWTPLGSPLSGGDEATLHFTYESSGAPWLLRQELTELKGVSQVVAFRWDGGRWRPRGSLRVRAVGAPGAAPDPAHGDAVLIGTGRFSAAAEPAYWLPAIPLAEGASGGQVVAVGGSAAYLTFDSRLFFSSDGGATWFLERWTPWSPRPSRQPLWTPGVDFWLDLPVAPRGAGLAVLWYDERRDAAPAVYLARWRERSGWAPAHEIPLGGPTAPSIDQALVTDRDRWLLLGPCRGAALDALIIEPLGGKLRRPSIALVPAAGR